MKWLAAGLALALCWRHPALPESPAIWLELTVLAAVLQLTAVPTERGRFFSTAAAAVLALGVTPSVGPAGAALTLLLALGLRQLVRGGSVEGDLVPCLVPLAILSLFGRLEVGQGALLVVNFHLILAWAVGRGSLLEQRLALLRMSVPMLAAILPPLLPWQALWLVPVLFGLQFAGERALAVARQHQVDTLERQVERVQTQAWEALQDVRHEAELRARVGQELAGAGDLDATARALVDIADRLLKPQSALVLEFDGDWAVLAGHSPSKERVLAARLLQLREPLWEAALAAPGPLTYAPLEEPRLLQGEGSGAAFPLGEGTLFYVGWAGSPPPQAQRLTPLLAGLAVPALATARRVSNLAQEAREGARLRRSVTRLGGLLQESWGMTARLEEEAVLAALAAALERQVPHSSRVIGLEGVLSTVVASGRPLLIGDLTATRMTPLAPGERSLLAVPLGPRGAVGLGAVAADAFSRDDLEVVQMLAVQAGLALGNATLHAQVVEALAQLKDSQAALIQSSKLAAVGQLAAGVAHELNTPLGAVTLALQMGLNQRPEDASLKMASQAAGRAKDIVAKLLFYSREGAVGRQTATLDGLVDDVLTMLGSQLRLDGVTVTFERGAPPAVNVNPNEIQQVLINLLINARDVSQHVTVRTGVEEGYAVAEVSDDGPGVDPAIADRIFDPFFTTKPVGKGTGLGLSVSMQIVLGHEGRLELGPGPGGHFVMRLPLQR